MANRLANSSVGGASSVWLERAMGLALLLVCAIALSKNQADPDFWGHVRYGRDAWRSGLPETATYSYTAAGRRWINHENLSELAFAWGVDAWGPAALLVLKCAAGLAVLGWMARAARRRGAGRAVVFGSMLLVSTNLMFFWCLRPQLFSYLFFVFLIGLLDRCFEGWEAAPGRPGRLERGAPREEARGTFARARLRWLWATPLLMALWANTHGAFVAGWAVLAVYLGCRGFQALGREGWAAAPAALEMAAVIAVSAAATVLNPYGLELHAWLWESLSTPRPEIVEWLPPELFHAAWIPWWIMVATAIGAAAASRRRRDPAHLLLLGLTLWQALEHRRHIAFFAILFGFWLPGHIQSALERLGWAGDRRSAAPQPSRAGRWLLGGALGAATLLMLGCLLGQLRRIPVRRDRYPVAAMQYIADQGLHGRLVATFRWAQYAIAAFGPPEPGAEGLLVAFDGRFRTCYPQEVVDAYFDFAAGEPGERKRCRAPNSPPPDSQRILQLGRPDLVLIERAKKHATDVMNRCGHEWVLLYQDQLAQLWGRAARYDDPHSIDYIPPRRRSITEEPQQGVVSWPALPKRRNRAPRLAARSDSRLPTSATRRGRDSPPALPASRNQPSVLPFTTQSATR